MERDGRKKKGQERRTPLGLPLWASLSAFVRFSNTHTRTSRHKHHHHHHAHILRLPLEL